MKNNIPASYWEKKDDKVHCLLCPNNCIISESKTGKCSVRINIEGTLYSLTDGHYISEAIDPIEKKPLYNFHKGDYVYSIGTIGCNLTCLFCQNHELVNLPTDFLRKFNTSDDYIINRVLENKCKGIAFTYNEPTMNYEQMYRIAKLAKENDLYTVAVSNGYLNEEPMREMTEVIDAWNIDLKGYDVKFYKDICGGHPEPVIRNIGIANEKSHVEVTFLLIDGINSSDEEIDTIARNLANINQNISFHISRYFPNNKMHIPPTKLETMKRAYEIAKSQLNNVYLGNLTTFELSFMNIDY